MQTEINRNLVVLYLTGLLIQPCLMWTYYEQKYSGNTDQVCQNREGLGRVCPELGVYAYKGELIRGPPSPHEYFFGDVELYNEDPFLVQHFMNDKVIKNYITSLVILMTACFIVILNQ